MLGLGEIEAAQSSNKFLFFCYNFSALCERVYNVRMLFNYLSKRNKSVSDAQTTFEIQFGICLSHEEVYYHQLRGITEGCHAPKNCTDNAENDQPNYQKLHLIVYKYLSRMKATISTIFYSKPIANNQCFIDILCSL